MNFFQKLKKVRDRSRDYPYMYARVSARRAKLLDRNDYEDLLKMDVNEIANRLAEGDYGREIDELGSEYSGEELVELAANRNLANTMAKLIEISPSPLENVISVYLRRYDIETLKRILRWKKNGSKENLSDLLMPVSRFGFEDLKEMMEMEYEELLEEIEFRNSEIDYSDRVEDLETLVEIENALDQAYIDELQILEERVGSMHFSRFIRDEIEYEAVRTALRLKNNNIEKEDIIEKVPQNGTKIVTAIADANNVQEAMDMLVEENKATRQDTLEQFEHAMQVERLRKALTMLHTEPLGMTSVLGYVVAKVIEVKNIRTLVQAKANDVETEIIEENLVINNGG